MEYMQKTVGQIVAANIATAKVFNQYGIDYCCHGDVPFAEACQCAGVSADEVADQLNGLQAVEACTPAFGEWPLDLLIDYVLKIHHRGIRREGPETLELLDKVVRAHADRHPELHQVRALFAESLVDLESHLQKEENVLFPYVMELFEAYEHGQRTAPMHCGTVNNPIRVMRMEHENEGNRYVRISALTQNYTAPADACASYRLVLERLKQFEQALHEHVHLENNLIFPRSAALETRCVG